MDGTYRKTISSGALEPLPETPLLPTKAADGESCSSSVVLNISKVQICITVINYDWSSTIFPVVMFPLPSMILLLMKTFCLSSQGVVYLSGPKKSGSNGNGLQKQENSRGQSKKSSAHFLRIFFSSIILFSNTRRRASQGKDLSLMPMVHDTR